METSNPLVKHFRHPAVYLKLPSQGQYWPEDSLILPANGELPVYPMTTRDEIILRTPDALINGSGVVNVIQNCIPGIINAWNMPSVDVDACLIAIRIASYGTSLDVSTTCPSCKHENENSVSLPTLLDQVKLPDYNDLIVSQGLTIKLKPQNYFRINKTNTVRYEEQRIIAVLNSSTMSIDEKEQNLKEITDKLIQLNVENLADSTEYILTEDGIKVVDHNHIIEFYHNTSSLLIRKIQEKLAEFAEVASINNVNIECEECKHVYKTEILFDYASFFAIGS